MLVLLFMTNLHLSRPPRHHCHQLSPTLTLTPPRFSLESPSKPTVFRVQKTTGWSGVFQTTPHQVYLFESKNGHHFFDLLGNKILSPSSYTEKKNIESSEKNSNILERSFLRSFFEKNKTKIHKTDTKSR